MRITQKDVEYVAALSKLRLSESQKQKFTTDLNDILTYMDKLNELDTQNVEPTAHVLNMKNVFREDEAKSSTDRQQILYNAPESEDGCFKVPKVVE